MIDFVRSVGTRVCSVAVVWLAVALLLRFASCASAQGASVDPALVGTWQMLVPNAQGTARWVWEIRPDGTYSFHAEGPGSTPSHSGTFQAAGGRYNLKSTTMDWTDNGSYSMQTPTTMLATGRLGTGFWQKVQPSNAGAKEAAPVTALNLIPTNVDWPVSGVPALAQRALAYAKAKWQPDAILTAIDIQLTAGLSNAQSPAGGVMIQFRFFSRAARSQLTLAPNSRAGEMSFGPAPTANEEHPLPPTFVDLPQAAAGVRTGGQITRAHLENYARGSFTGEIGLYGPEWVIDSGSAQRAAVSAEAGAGGEARISRLDSPEVLGTGEGENNLIWVNIMGLRSNGGVVYCELYDSARGFPKNTRRSIAVTNSTISGNHAQCQFYNEDPGTYAILVIDDQSHTHRLDIGPEGAPRQGYGISNNPAMPFAALSFPAAAITYRGGRLDVPIYIRYQ